MYAALLSSIKQSFTPSPISAMIGGVWDVKLYMEPFLCKIQNHSRYGVFRFTRNNSDHVEMHYKRWSDGPWEPKDAGIEVISVR